MNDPAKVLKDNAKELGDLLVKPSKNNNKKGGKDTPSTPSKGNSSGGNRNNCKKASESEMSIPNIAMREAAEIQIEKLLPQKDIDLPPTIPTQTPTQSKVATSPKAAANGTSGTPKKLI